MRFTVVYADDAVRHLRDLTARQQSIVLDAVVEHLTFDPLRETRHRKRMRSNPLAAWELRVGDLRVYYKVRLEPEPSAIVVAVGIKDRSIVWVGGEEMDL